jgi:hypothetical protein
MKSFKDMPGQTENGADSRFFVFIRGRNSFPAKTKRRARRIRDPSLRAISLADSL